MKTFLLVVIIAAAVGYYLWHNGGLPQVGVHEPEIQVVHLAPHGTFFLVQYVSTTTPNGVVGFTPGQQVQFVSADKARGTLLVTDGEHQVAVKPEQLTNDKDVAALAMKQDQQSQSQVAAALDKQRKQAAKTQQQADVNAARDLTKSRSRTGSQLGGTALDRPAKQTGNGNPYSYLNR